jgi:hypothetical protein
MNRRSFLAFLPALSATPFMAKEFIKTDNEIIIQRPELVTAKMDHSDVYAAFKNGILKFHVIHENKIIGEGYITELSARSEMFPITTRDGWEENYPGPMSVSIAGVLSGSLKPF